MLCSPLLPICFKLSCQSLGPLIRKQMSYLGENARWGSMRGQSLNVQLFGAWSKICNDEIRMSPRGPLPSGQCTSSWCVVSNSLNFDSSCRNECTNISTLV